MSAPGVMGFMDSLRRAAIVAEQCSDSMNRSQALSTAGKPIYGWGGCGRWDWDNSRDEWKSGCAVFNRGYGPRAIVVCQRMCRAPAASDRGQKAGFHTGSSKEEARAVIVIAMSGLHLQVQGWPEAPFIETNAVLSNGLVLRHCSRCGKNGCSGAIPGARVKSVSCRQRTCILALANPLMPMSRSGGTPSMGCETVVCWAVSRLGALLPPPPPRLCVVYYCVCTTGCVRVPCGCRRGVDFWVASTHR